MHNLAYHCFEFRVVVAEEAGENEAGHDAVGTSLDAEGEVVRSGEAVEIQNRGLRVLLIIS